MSERLEMLNKARAIATMTIGMSDELSIADFRAISDPDASKISTFRLASSWYPT